MYTKLDKRSLCNQCLGCNKLEDKNFTGKINCNNFRAVDKRVWCADEVIENFERKRKK